MSFVSRKLVFPSFLPSASVGTSAGEATNGRIIVGILDKLGRRSIDGDEIVGDRLCLESLYFHPSYPAPASEHRQSRRPMANHCRHIGQTRASIYRRIPIEASTPETLASQALLLSPLPWLPCPLHLSVDGDEIGGPVRVGRSPTAAETVSADPPKRYLLILQALLLSPLPRLLVLCIYKISSPSETG